MRRFLILILCLWTTPAAAQLLLYDGFDYTPGALLAPASDTDPNNPDPACLHNVAYDLDWRYVGTGSNSEAPHTAPNPSSGSLSFADAYPSTPGLPNSVGDRVAYAQETGSARINVPTAPASGTTYWSGLFKVQTLGDTAQADNPGAIIAGFNNSQGPGTSISTAGAILYLRRASVTDPGDTTDYQLGTGTNTNQAGCSSGGACTNRIYATSVPLAPGDTVFVVGAYNLVSSATQDDIASLWINPDPADFGAASPPTPTITAMSTGSAVDAIDPLFGVASFFLRNNNSIFGTGQEWYFDELRVGSDWASVTTAGGLPGDFNSDGKVDAGDYVSWRKNNGTNNALPNDNGLGTPITSAHYDLWRANFGSGSPGSGSSLGGSSAVPEPAGLSLAMLAIGFTLISARRYG